MARVWFRNDDGTWVGKGGNRQVGYQEGEWITQDAPLPDGRFNLRVTHDPPNRLYLAVEDASRPGEYERWTDNDNRYLIALQGAVGAEASRAVETADISRSNATEVYEAKEEDLKNYTDTVNYSSFKMVGQGATEFWVNASLRSRIYRFNVNGFYQWIPPGGTTPGDEPEVLNLLTKTNREAVVSDTGRAWRDIPAWIVRVDNGNKIRIKADQAEYETLVEAEGRFTIDVAYAADAKEAELEGLFNAADGLPTSSPEWEALAAYDETRDDPTHPWPEHNTGVFNGVTF